MKDLNAILSKRSKLITVSSERACTWPCMCSVKRYFRFARPPDHCRLTYVHRHAIRNSAFYTRTFTVSDDLFTIVTWFANVTHRTYISLLHNGRRSTEQPFPALRIKRWQVLDQTQIFFESTVRDGHVLVKQLFVKKIVEKNICILIT